MRALHLESFGDDSTLHEVQIPRPVPQSGEVLVRVESTPIGHFDFVVLMGMYGGLQVPLVPGVEGAGTVVECGAGTEELLNKRVQVMGVGMWAEYKVAKAEDVVQLRDEVDIDQAAAMWGNPLAVMMFRECIRQGNHKAAVQNAANSALGKMFIRLCREEGIPLINIVRSADKAESLRALGAENVLNSADAGFQREYKETCEKLQATVAFDPVAGDMTGKLLSGLCPGGVTYVFGSLSHQPSNGLQASDLIFQGKRVEGLGTLFWLNRKTNAEKQAIYLEIQQRISTVFHTEFIGHYPLSEIKTALQRYKADLSAGKMLLHPNRQ